MFCEITSGFLAILAMCGSILRLGRARWCLRTRIRRRSLRCLAKIYLGKVVEVNGRAIVPVNLAKKRGTQDLHGADHGPGR